MFEQRARVGGIWDYHNESKELPERLAAPQLSADTGLSKPLWDQSGTKKALGDDAGDQARFLSPLYDRLETNIPRSLMGFSDLDWPQDAQLFPKHETVTDYIEKYAEDVKPLIKFQTQVLEIRPEGEGWSVKTQKIAQDSTGEVSEERYDAVVVASGHFTVPYIPDVKGMKEWSEKYPGVISHSLYYKRPEEYHNKVHISVEEGRHSLLTSMQKVVVVGNGPSGLDIAAQIMTTCTKPLIQSQKSESMMLSDPSPSKTEKPEIDEFILEDRALRFQDGSIEKDIDIILYSTGYFYSFPFLRSLDPPLIGDGTHVQNLYQHMICRQHPTLMFPVIQQRVIPFPMAEVQAAVIARLWSNRLSLASEEEMRAWEQKTHDETGGGRNFHLLSFPKDANYINSMYDWAMSAPDADTVGKKPPRWGEKQYWMRERFPAIKKAFQDRGDARHKVKTLEELGFDFEEYMEQKRIESKSVL